jgi:serine phosphatase RsbU (regulator of sigma subunit)
MDDWTLQTGLRMETPFFRINDSGGSWDYPLRKDRIKVGRAKDNDVVLHTRVNISREHLEIVKKGESWVLHDLNTDFGTYVNRKAVKSCQLNHGDLIHLASLDLPEMLYLTKDTPLVADRQRPPDEQTTQIHDLQIISHIADTLRSIGSRGVLTDLLDRIADNAIELSGADRGFILLADDKGHLSIETARRKGRVTLPAAQREISRVVPREVYESGSTQVIDLRGTDASGKHGYTVEIGVVSALCVPLNPIQFYDGAAGNRDRATRVGVLYLDSKSTIHLRSAYTLPLIEALAEEASAAIQNVRLLGRAEEANRAEESLRVAGKIQESLQPPRCRNGDFFEVAGSTVPCEQVGGDFLDYPILDGGRALGLALADVAGKGLPGALLAALAQGTFSGLAQLELSPSRVLCRINEVISARENPSRYVTFHYAVMLPDGTLRSCNAGHFSPLIIRTGGKVENLTVGGIPLGIYRTEDYQEESVQLGEGDLVVIFSDGITEAMSRTDELFGEKRLEDCLCTHRDKPVEEILECIHRVVKDFVLTGPQRDDMTVLVARYLGQ